METKTYTGKLELKEDGKPGEFKAVFSTLSVTDLHGDITAPGAFKNGQEVFIEGWNHDYNLPVGKGVIMSDNKEAWVEGSFFLDIAAGKDHYTVVKNAEKLTQWSYTFDILDAKPIDPKENYGASRMLIDLDTVGIAPVTRGAGIATRTTLIKSADTTGDTQTADGTGGQAETGEPGDGTPSDDVNLRIMLAEIRNIIHRMEIE